MAVTIARGMNRFALLLYQELRREGGNLFFSPASLSSVLAMAGAGARGETAKEMQEVLGLPLDREDLHEALGRSSGDGTREEEAINSASPTASGDREHFSSWRASSP